MRQQLQKLVERLEQNPYHSILLFIVLFILKEKVYLPIIDELFSLFLIALFIFCYKKLYGLDEFGLILKPRKDMIGLGVVVTFNLLFHILKVLHAEPPYFNADEFWMIVAGGYLFMFILGMILIPISEELVYRGIFFGFFRHLVHILVVVVLTAMLWASAHSPVEAAIGIFGVGILYGLLRAAGFSLYVLVFGHFINNVIELFYAPHNRAVDTSAQFLMQYYFLLVVFIIALFALRILPKELLSLRSKAKG